MGTAAKRLRFTVTAGQTENGQPSCTITTSTPDRSRDRVMPKGIMLENFIKNPVVLFGHKYGEIPVGTATSIRSTEEGLEASWKWLENDEFAARVRNAWDQGVLRATSIGFIPQKSAFDTERNGYDFLESELLEFSIVPVPANAEAVRTLGFEVPDEEEEPDGKFRYLKSAFRPAILTSAIIGDRPASQSDEKRAEDPIRWNPALSKAFDVTREQFPAANAEYLLAAKYIDCDIAELRENGCDVPSARMGSFLSALDEHLAHYRVEGLRNLNSRSEEAPPVWETIQLNSTRSGDFLIDGTRFLRHPEDKKIVLRLRSTWFGLSVAAYAKGSEIEIANALMSSVWSRARELNFLKGEAFSLSGEFLERTTEQWSDLFLEPKNIQAVSRLVKLVNEHGATMDNRGMLLCGPPGTGKTLSLRIVRNEAKATFIWVSARDFYRLGEIGGLTYAFDLARECAPSILAFEDVDAWIGAHSMDLLKTEMDGVGQSRGVSTILSTNFPELLPKALVDRPGRFHDVLQFALPTEVVRLQMLRKWMPELSEAQATKAVKATAGYSGAHVRDLARFVGIIREQESLGLGEALELALVKLAEQRELINQTQAAGSRYRAPDFIATKNWAEEPKKGKAASIEVALDVKLKLSESAAARQVRYDAIARLLAQAQSQIEAAASQVADLASAPDDVAAARLSVLLAQIEQAEGALDGAETMACHCLGMAPTAEAPAPDGTIEIPQMSAEAVLAFIEKAGKRHSTKDQQMIQSAHDLCVDLGAGCKSEPPPASEATVETEAPAPEALSLEIAEDPAPAVVLEFDPPSREEPAGDLVVLELRDPSALGLAMTDDQFLKTIQETVQNEIASIASNAARSAYLYAHGRVD